MLADDGLTDEQRQFMAQRKQMATKCAPPPPLLPSPSMARTTAVTATPIRRLASDPNPNPASHSNFPSLKP